MSRANRPRFYALQRMKRNPWRETWREFNAWAGWSPRRLGWRYDVGSPR